MKTRIVAEHSNEGTFYRAQVKRGFFSGWTPINEYIFWGSEGTERLFELEAGSLEYAYAAIDYVLTRIEERAAYEASKKKEIIKYP